MRAVNAPPSRRAAGGAGPGCGAPRCASMGRPESSRCGDGGVMGWETPRGNRGLRAVGGGELLVGTPEAALFWGGGPRVGLGGGEPPGWGLWGGIPHTATSGSASGGGDPQQWEPPRGGRPQDGSGGVGVGLGLSKIGVWGGGGDCWDTFLGGTFLGWGPRGQNPPAVRPPGLGSRGRRRLGPLRPPTSRPPPLGSPPPRATQRVGTALGPPD